MPDGADPAVLRNLQQITARGCRAICKGIPPTRQAAFFLRITLKDAPADRLAHFLCNGLQRLYQKAVVNLRMVGGANGLENRTACADAAHPDSCASSARPDAGLNPTPFLA